MINPVFSSVKVISKWCKMGGGGGGVLYTMLLNDAVVLLCLEWLAGVLGTASVGKVQFPHFVKGAGKEGSNLVDLHQRQVVHAEPLVIQHSQTSSGFRLSGFSKILEQLSDLLCVGNIV